MSLDVYEGMTSATQTAILNETNFLFNSMLDKASGGMAQINVTFNDEREGNKNFVPGIKIVGDLQSGNEVSIGGFSSNGFAIVSGFNNEGMPNSVSNIANSIVHELLHSIRIETWESQTNDTELIKKWQNGQRKFITTENTHSSIYKNILMYVFQNIDGLTATERFGGGIEMNEITPQQVSLMIQEIDLQMSGYGKYTYDPLKSLEENGKEEDDKVTSYWQTSPKLKEE